MHRSSLYRVCGPAIVVGGITLLAAFSLRPLAPETILATGDFDLSKWVVANWMFAVGSVILLGGWIGLTEHLNDAVVEGWSTLGLGGVVIGCVGLAVAGAVNAESLPLMLDSNSPERAAQAYFTITMMMDALGMMAWTMLWIGTALSGLAIAEDDEYPHRLGYSGLAIAIIEISTQLMKPDTLLHDAFGILGCVWLVSVGFIFSRIDRTSPALTSADASLV